MGLVTFDLDSTLADTRHRHHLINPDGVSTDWHAYSMACPGDAPIAATVALWHALAAAGHAMWIVTGRDARALAPTQDWLRAQGIVPDGILMDAHDHGAPSHEAFKVLMVRKAMALSQAEHLLHVDDWPPVHRALAAAGFRCLAVTPPRVLADFDPDGHLTFV